MHSCFLNVKIWQAYLQPSFFLALCGVAAVTSTSLPMLFMPLNETILRRHEAQVHIAISAKNVHL